MLVKWSPGCWQYRNYRGVFLCLWNGPQFADSRGLQWCVVVAGTFITMDISTQRLADIHTVDIRNTVRRIRTQRAFSIQMPDQYIFCHLALIEHAQSLGLLAAVDLDGFDDESSEDDWVSFQMLWMICILWRLNNVRSWWVQSWADLALASCTGISCFTTK